MWKDFSVEYSVKGQIHWKRLLLCLCDLPKGVSVENVSIRCFYKLHVLVNEVRQKLSFLCYLHRYRRVTKSKNGKKRLSQVEPSDFPGLIWGWSIHICQGKSISTDSVWTIEYVPSIFSHCCYFVLQQDLQTQLSSILSCPLTDAILSLNRRLKNNQIYVGSCPESFLWSCGMMY